jgi:hypothetical protein
MVLLLLGELQSAHCIAIYFISYFHSATPIFCTAYGKGRRYDLWILSSSRVQLHPDTAGLANKGYQGWHKFHPKCCTPKKKPRGGSLSTTDKLHNHSLAQRRVIGEHVNRRLKIFRILSERYRNRRRRFGLRCNLIAALYNYELALIS